MSKKGPPRNLTPGLCQRLQHDMLKACQEVAARHGLVVDDKGPSNIDLRWGFDVAFRVSIPLADGSTLDPEQLRFAAQAEAFGLSPGDYGREFSTGREAFRITGIDPRRPKYPVSAERLPDRQGFKFTAEQVALLLQGGMKDVTPCGYPARGPSSSRVPLMMWTAPPRRHRNVPSWCCRKPGKGRSHPHDDYNTRDRSRQVGVSASWRRRGGGHRSAEKAAPGRCARLSRQARTLPIGMEACATSHHWARAIAALGHEVRLIPPAYVKPYVKRQKNDAADAEAICEAVSRPSMRFVPIKGAEQQSVLVLHRSRDLLMRQRTMILNAIRAHLAEFGVITAQGPRKIVDLVRRLADPDELDLPTFARSALLSLAAQLATLAEEIGRIEQQLMIWHRQNEASWRLEAIPGIGLITATALAASVPDPSAFRSGRQFAAWLGLVPRQTSSGGKDRLGHISKMGNGYLRRLLVVGATSVTRRAGTDDTRASAWLRSLLGRKPARVVTVAIANKTARIAWAMLARRENYRAAAMA